MLDIVSCGIARNNSTGQSSLGKYAEALKGTGLLEVTFGSSGITGRIGTGGIDLGGSLYDFGKRMNDVNSLKKYEAEFGTEKGQTAYNAYIYGDWTVENTAARLASKRDELIFTAGTDYKAHTTQNTAGTGRIIEMNNLGDKYNNAITLGHEAYRNGIVDNNNKKETLDAVLSHVKMASAMENDMKKAGIGFDKQLAIEVALYNRGVLDVEKLAEDYDSSADYWKLTKEGNLAYDGKADLYDENDYLIKKVKAKGIESGLVEILYGTNATEEQKLAVRMMMKDSGLTHSVDKNNPLDSEQWFWTGLGSTVAYIYDLNDYTGFTDETNEYYANGEWVFDDNVNIAQVNMGKDISLNSINELYSSTKTKYSQYKSFIESVYGSAVSFLNYTNNSEVATSMLYNAYTDSQAEKIFINQQFYNDAIQNGLETHLMAKNAKVTQDFDVNSGNLSVVNSSIPGASYFEEEHTGIDYGKTGTELDTPGGIWELTGKNGDKIIMQLQ